MKKWISLFMAVLLTVGCFGSVEAKAANRTYNTEQTKTLVGTVWNAEDKVEFTDCAVQLMFQYENLGGTEESNKALGEELKEYGNSKNYKEFVFGEVTGAEFENVYMITVAADNSGCSVLFTGENREELESSGRYFVKKSTVWKKQSNSEGWMVKEVLDVSDDPNFSYAISDYYYVITLVPYDAPETVEKDVKDSVTKAGCNHEMDHIITRQPTEAVDGVVSVKCIKCPHIEYTYNISGHGAFLLNTVQKISTAKAGSTVTITTDRWMSFNKAVLNAIEANPDVTVVVEYWYSDGETGTNRSFKIPAGTMVSQFANEEGYCGFEYLAYQIALAKITE